MLDTISDAAYLQGWFQRRERPKELVLERYPNAWCADCVGYFRIANVGLVFLSWRHPTEAAAWEDAARRLER